VTGDLGATFATLAVLILALIVLAYVLRASIRVLRQRRRTRAWPYL